MNKKKLLTMVLSLVLIGAVGVGATLAYFTDKADVKNVVTMGYVDIKLTENEVTLNENGEYVQKTDTTAVTDTGLEFEKLVPGMTLPKNPTITVNEGSKDCYVRAKVTVSGLDNLKDAEGNPVTLAPVGLNVDSDKWYLASDNYYYYKDKMSEGNTAVLFTEVTIPGTWTNAVVNKEFNISIEAEAIQADYFEKTGLVKETGSDIIKGWVLDQTIDKYVPPTPQNGTGAGENAGETTQP